MSSAAIESALDAAYAQFKDLKEGANADYIPALAKVDPNIFGIALVTADGRVYTKGDVELRGVDPVDLQGLHDGEGHRGAGSGRDREGNMGVDATGQVFNSINAVEQYKGAEMNAHGESRRHHRDQHGLRRVRVTRSGTRSSLTTATSRDASWA